MAKRTVTFILIGLILSIPIGCTSAREEDDWLTWAWDNKCTLIGTGVGIAAAPFVGPAAAGFLGFGQTGIAAGSIAAKMMSVAATYGGGGVASGGVVATLQSVGAAGMTAVGSAASVAVGGVVGAAVGKSTCTEKDNGKC